MSNRQRTIKAPVSLTGVGLHTGRKVTVVLKPAPEGAGISFKRVDLDRQPVISLVPKNIYVDNSVVRCTTVGHGAEAIHTVEHLMSVCSGLGLDNLSIELDGSEMPGMDGSAVNFAQAIQSVGIVEQNRQRSYIRIEKEIRVDGKNAFISVEPCEEFRLTYTLEYDHPLLRKQVFDVVLTPETFLREVAPARTFCLASEAQSLQAAGLGKGANFKNTLVVGESGVIENTLRFENEFARHKTLDVIGDLYLLGRPIKGHVKAYRSGHALNVVLMEKIVQECMNSNGGKKMTPENGSMDIHEIMKCLPHRFPFLLVDRILELKVGERAVGVKNVTANDNFFTGHFPTRPVMPGVLMVEALAQVSGILLRKTEAHSSHVGLFFSITNAKFRKTVEPGDQLVMEVEVIRDRGKAASTKGVSRVNGEVVCEVEMMFAFLDEKFLTE